MLYDYIINYFYPNFGGFLGLLFVMWIVITATSLISRGYAKKNNLPRTKTIYAIHTLFFTTFIVMFLIPDRNFVVYHFGDSREQLSQEQMDDINRKLDEHYEKSKDLFLACLDKGQKQPNSTVFNDTNEVIKTCYDVGRFKF